ncbi:MAG: hypothetical protein JWN67_2555 [Actinomycetia bacterium]|nr:hypothetical protein [Actinomycetes bacterium]
MPTSYSNIPQEVILLACAASRLTPRQMRIVLDIVDGTSLRAEARRLGVSLSTVKREIRAAGAALGIASRDELVVTMCHPRRGE